MIRLVLGCVHIRHAIVRQFDCEHEDLSTQGGEIDAEPIVRAHWYSPLITWSTAEAG